MEKRADELFILDWYKEFNWEADPFQDTILSPPSYFVAGYENERQRINSFIIKNQRFGILTGEKGTGKTSILKWLDYELKNYKRRMISNYIDGSIIGDNKNFLRLVIAPILNVNQKLFEKIYTEFGLESVRKELKGSEPGFITNLFSKAYLNLEIHEIIKFIGERLKDKRLVLLIDDAQFLSKEDLEIISKIYKSGINVQIILSGCEENLNKLKLDQCLKDELKIELKSFSLESLNVLVKRRIEFFGGKQIDPFNENILKQFYDKSNNPRKLLNLCSDYALKMALKKLEEQALRKLQPVSIVTQPKTIEKKPEPKKIEKEVLAGKEEEKYQIKAIKRDSSAYDIKVIKDNKKSEDYQIKKVVKK